MVSSAAIGTQARVPGQEEDEQARCRNNNSNNNNNNQRDVPKNAQFTIHCLRDVVLTISGRVHQQGLQCFDGNVTLVSVHIQIIRCLGLVDK